MTNEIYGYKEFVLLIIIDKKNGYISVLVFEYLLQSAQDLVCLEGSYI
jgi:hypothetical protein